MKLLSGVPSAIGAPEFNENMTGEFFLDVEYRPSNSAIYNNMR